MSEKLDLKKKLNGHFLDEIILSVLDCKNVSKLG